jgi:2-dehydro-3-deoxyglucarate aldolase
MNRQLRIQQIRANLRSGGHSVGSWMQIPHASVAEIMGQAGYDWVAVDMEHGSVGAHQLPDLFRALELGGTLPLVRLACGNSKDCKQALDAGAGGVIVPMVENGASLAAVRDACRWPPAGIRGVGFSRANLFGKHFETYRNEAQAPLLIAMIENRQAVENLDEILRIKGLDALLIGPYDLSASMNLTAQFDHPHFLKTMQAIRTESAAREIPCGVHVVAPSFDELRQRIAEGYRFLAYSIDAVMLNQAADFQLRAK